MSTKRTVIPIVVMSALLGFAACMTDEDYRNLADRKFTINLSRYAKDPRTDLCFLISGEVAAHVPCTPEVEKLLVNKR